VRGDLNIARDIGNELLTLAPRQQDSTFLLEAYWALSGVLFLLGEFVLVQPYLEQAVVIFESQRAHVQALRHGTVPGIHCLSWLSLTSWMLGFPEQALQQSKQTLALAQQQTSHFLQNFCFFQARMLHHCRREASSILDISQSEERLQSDQAVDNRRDHHRYILEGWSLFMEGK
jgi:adenylate cyclase